MADGPIRRKTEKAVRDRAGVPVGLLYDETNDKTIMQRGTADGQGTSALYVWNGTTGAWEMLAADGITNALRVIDYEHHEIHSGSVFRAQAFDDAIGSGGTLVIGLRIPDQAKEPHMLWEFIHEGDMTMTVYEGVTITLGTGTDVTCKNSNRNSAKTSVLQGSATGAWVAGNVTKNPTWSGGDIISLKRNYAAKNAGQTGSRRAEVVLATDTDYAFVLTNNETSTQGGQIRLEWYEHSPLIA